MPLINRPFGFHSNMDDYLLARLIIAKKLLGEGKTEEAKSCIEDIIKDFAPK